MDDENEGEGERVPDMAEATFEGHSDAVYCVAINPKMPNQFISGGGDDRGFLWAVGQGGVISSQIELIGHTDTVSTVGFSADGTLAASGCYGGVVKVWETSSGALKTTLEGPEDIEWLTWHNSGHVLLAGSQDGTVWMWQAATGTCMQVFAGHERKVTCGAFNSTGKTIFTGSEDASVRVWAPRTGECRHVFTGHGFHEGPITCITSHPDPEQAYLILSGSEDGTARLTHVQTKRVLGTLVHCLPETGSVECVGFCFTHPWVATGGTDGSLKVWDSVSGHCRQTCTHPGPVTKLRWHPSSPVVLTSCADGNVRIWDARTGVCLSTLTGHSDMILDFNIAAVHSQGTASGAGAGAAHMVLVTASDDCTAKNFYVGADRIGALRVGGGGLVGASVAAQPIEQV
ncbi:unnamed protein product [Discosporangium mesarthrocarpum]